jgi:glycosyltransferase involved in cell wall biosynthesis
MHVIAGLRIGGTEMMCLRLTRHWNDEFDQHVVAWSPADRALEPEFRGIARCTLSVAPDRALSRFQKWKWIVAMIARERPDAVLIHIFGIPHLIVAAAARLAGVKSIAAWVGNPPPEAPSPRRRYKTIITISKLLRCPIVTCSTAVEQEFLKLGVKLPRNSKPSPNGIDVNAVFDEAERARKAQPDPPPVIAMVSRLDTIKDHATLLNAFARVQLRMPEVQLWIVGDGACRRQLEALAEDLGICDATTFFGNRSNVPSLLGQATIFAFSTTRAEGFGIVLIEAMAAGVPIVASDVAACREVLAGGKTGILVPPSDPERMSEAIRHLLDLPETRKRLTDAGLRRVQNKYAIEICARRWENILFTKPTRMCEPAACVS